MIIKFPVWTVRPRNTSVEIHLVTRIPVKFFQRDVTVVPLPVKGIVGVNTWFEFEGFKIVDRRDPIVWVYSVGGSFAAASAPMVLKKVLSGRVELRVGRRAATQPLAVRQRQPFELPKEVPKPASESR